METEKNQARKRPVGAPPTVNGRQITLYLDEDSIRIAANLGDGNVSKGIRKALRKITTEKSSAVVKGCLTTPPPQPTASTPADKPHTE